ncbi:MAG TPA: outer membrane beta-barrel protein [Cyclobacteriaceae bacterium]|nr:outer membrane beta-barrel protein [Cyclobacteriaceae bacterium]
MTVRAFALFILVLIASSAQAQTTPKTRARPNIPGNFIVDFGVNGTMESPILWKQGLIGSRTVNVYYTYPLRFGRSRFSFNPGIGLSMERFKFKNGVMLNNATEANANAQVEKYDFISAPTFFNANVRKSMLVTNYVEVPLELRYDTKPEDISRSINIAVGVRGGWMYDSFSKIKYKEEGQTKKIKDKQDWGLTQLRYGLSLRVGIGAFNFFTFYNLTPLFQKDKAPFNESTLTELGTTPTNMQTFTAGISINGF